MTKVGIAGFTRDEVDVLRNLLYPYEVEFSKEPDASDLIICRGSFSDESKPLIRVPAFCQRQNGYEGPKSQSGGVVDLSFDLMSTSWKIFDTVMNPKVSFAYKFCTRLPLQYNMIPPVVRNCLLRMKEIDANLSHHLAIEAARRALAEAFEALGFHLERRSRPSLFITHDIDTEKGLRRASLLKEVENKLELQSTWFLPSNEYGIPKDIARSLGDGSTIGSHDVKHDGGLIHVGERDRLIERLRQSKVKLEVIFDRQIKCFRSPLLQFSRRIVSGLGLAGYELDSSLPCWEPVHPPTTGQFGVECVQPFEIDGVVEVPLTLLQDHQVLNVLGMNTREATRFLCEQAKLVRFFDGDIVLLVHPDYSFSLDLGRYKELLQSLLEIQMRSEPDSDWNGSCSLEDRIPSGRQRRGVARS